MATKLEQAIAAIKAGDKATGKQLLAEVIKTDRNNEQAWLWLIQTDITHEQKIKSLQNVLKINPANEIAKQDLAKLQQPEPKRGLLKSSKVTSPTIKPIAPTEKASQPQSSTDTKICPYCAETIKADAVVCRFCGKDLQTAGKTLQARPAISDQQLIQQYISRRTQQGWQVVNQTESSAQLRKPKRWSRGLLILGGLLLIFFGTGLLFWLLAVIDYALKKEQIIYVTADDLRAGTDQKPTSAWSGPMILAGITIGAVLLCIVFALMSSAFLTPGDSSRINQASENVSSASVPQPIEVAEGYVFIVPGAAFIDGRDLEAQPPLTIKQVNLWEQVPRNRVICNLHHGREVQLLEAQYYAPEGRYYFLVQAGNCQGWLSEDFLSAEKHDPVGDLF